MSDDYTLLFTPAANRADAKLPLAVRRRIRASLDRVVADASSAAGFPGKRVKALRGTRDRVVRLRVGDYRVMFDVDDDARVVLVLGIVHRSDLERWLRSR